MALLAEQIVQEWLTRQNYFTMRGVKLGYDEIDLLAIRRLMSGEWEHKHIEVQVSLRPVSYISPLSAIRQQEFGINKARSAAKRSDEQLKLSISDWVTNKFKSPKKANLRKKLTNSEEWKFAFVHGIVKESKELQYIQELGVEIIPIAKILTDLQNQEKLDFTTGAATDIIELFQLLNIKNKQVNV